MTFALWWLYFLEPLGNGLAHHRDRAFLWGFAQYGVFLALAGLGAGLEVAIAETGHRVELSPIAASYAVAIPVALFLVLLWAVSAPIVSRSIVRPGVMFPGASVILLLPLWANAIGLPGAVAAIATVCASMVAVTIVMATARDARRPSRAVADAPIDVQPPPRAGGPDVHAVPVSR